MGGEKTAEHDVNLADCNPVSPSRGRYLPLQQGKSRADDAPARDLSFASERSAFVAHYFDASSEQPNRGLPGCHVDAHAVGPERARLAE
jgi:hypothetical protein